MHFEGEEDADFVEAGSARSVGSPQAPVQEQVQPVSRIQRDSQITDSSLSDTEARLATYERRGRALVLFVEIPVLSFIALNDKTPGLLRAGAGLLAAWKALELARGSSLAAQNEVKDWVNG